MASLFFKVFFLKLVFLTDISRKDMLIHRMILICFHCILLELELKKCKSDWKSCYSFFINDCQLFGKNFWFSTRIEQLVKQLLHKQLCPGLCLKHRWWIWHSYSNSFIKNRNCLYHLLCNVHYIAYTHTLRLGTL